MGIRLSGLIVVPMRTRFVLSLVATFVACAPALAADSDKTIHPVVVELFTSQGCSDCPPADRLLAEIAQKRDVIALTLPVTYWDMLGWKDTFATDTNTQRQKAYARMMNHSGIYTPQMILDGATDVVGSQRNKVLAAIAQREQANEATTDIPIAIAASEQKVQIAIAGNPRAQQGNVRIWVLQTRSQARVDVEEGENGGRTLTFVNLVRQIKDAGQWNGGPKIIDLPIVLREDDRDGIVVILQNRDYGAIIGAAMLQSSDRVDPEDEAQ